jgi:hypothetical protein
VVRPVEVAVQRRRPVAGVWRLTSAASFTGASRTPGGSATFTTFEPSAPSRANQRPPELLRVERRRTALGAFARHTQDHTLALSRAKRA